MTRCIAHCDADRFFFAVEALERPELASETRPVVVGHDPRRAPRAIVTTANDAARARGIGSGSGISGARARRLAPDALFVPPRHDLYRAYSDRLLAVLREASPTVQPLSIDEAWLEWGPHGFDPALAHDLRTQVLDRTGLSISVGVAASKPAGVRVVPPGQEPGFLAPQPVRALVGVGPRTAERLVESGVTTIGELAARPRAELVALFGQSCPRC